MPDVVKKVPKVAILSTKLSTIWQIIDHLSKKIDYRPMVDNIDHPGHPGERQTEKWKNVEIYGPVAQKAMK